MTKQPTGFVIVDKPAGMTSHDVVARMRRLAGTRKVGHGGTLDPMATGVLVVAVGQITRLLTFVTGCDKSYEATIRLGQATITDDAEGDITATVSTEGVTDDAINTTLSTMSGHVKQVPSAVSAVKIDGKRAYKRVRDGEDVEIPAREVTISRLEVRDIRRVTTDPEQFGAIDVDITVDCSTGTYIRAIARDLGTALGVGGHLTRLRRTRVGGFTIDESKTLDALAEAESPITHTTVETVTRLMPRRDIEAAEATTLGHGGRIPLSGVAGPYAAIDPNGRVVAVVVERDGRTKSLVVLPESTA
ncbi:tRNA pseudouridine synthase B [Stackebrandtia soli]